MLLRKVLERTLFSWITEPKLKKAQERCIHKWSPKSIHKAKKHTRTNPHEYTQTHIHIHVFFAHVFFASGKLVHRYSLLSPLSRSMQTQVFSMVIKQTPVQVVWETGRGCVPPASPLFLGSWLVQRRLTALWSWRFCLMFLFLAKRNDHGPDQQLLISGFLGEHTFTARVHPLF